MTQPSPNARRKPEEASPAVDADAAQAGSFLAEIRAGSATARPAPAAPPRCGGAPPRPPAAPGGASRPSTS
jgi:hypothetical protein